MTDYLVPEPFQFNPLKHHLGFIRTFIADKVRSGDLQDLNRTIRHIGSSVMDIYSGRLSLMQILDEVNGFLRAEDIGNKLNFSRWAGTGFNDYRFISLSDRSRWALKYHDGNERFIHLFPARSSPHTFRVKANTLKSAILYLAVIGKDYITGDDLNTARAMSGLSPVKDVTETAAISGMIEILRNP